MSPGKSVCIRAPSVAKIYLGSSFAFSHGIIFRSFRPTTSTGCELSCSYSRLKSVVIWIS
jgi:hypothetical protein